MFSKVFSKTLPFSKCNFAGVWLQRPCMTIEGKTIYVSLAHRYWNAAWTPEKNHAVYGPDGSPQGLGANLKIVGRAWASSADLSGALAELKRAVDHRSLFDDFAEFKSLPSTLEAMGAFLGKKLFSLEGRWHSLEVWETEHLGVVVWPGRPEIQLRFRVSNLQLTLQGVAEAESALLTSREPVLESVREAYRKLPENPQPDVAEWLLKELSTRLPGLVEVRVDLARQKFMTAMAKGLIEGP